LRRRWRFQQNIEFLPFFDARHIPSCYPNGTVISREPGALSVPTVKAYAETAASLGPAAVALGGIGADALGGGSSSKLSFAA
jgi:hypothetical protein